MPYRHTLLFLLAALTNVNASAWSRIADAHVHSVNGMPCFSITKKEEARNGLPFLGALMVSDMSVQPVKEVWGVLPTARNGVTHPCQHMHTLWQPAYRCDGHAR